MWRGKQRRKDDKGKERKGEKEEQKEGKVYARYVIKRREEEGRKGRRMKP